MNQKGFLENFAMIIPQTAIYSLNGYQIFRATRQEFDEFKKHFEGQKYQQLQLRGVDMDLWIRHNDMVIDHIAYSIQELFNRWKKSPPAAEASFSFRSFQIKRNK